MSAGSDIMSIHFTRARSETLSRLMVGDCRFAGAAEHDVLGRARGLASQTLDLE